MSLSRQASKYLYHKILQYDKKAVLSQGEPHEAAVNFDTCRLLQLQRQHAVSLPQQGFIAGLCRLHAVNHLPKK